MISNMIELLPLNIDEYNPHVSIHVIMLPTIAGIELFLRIMIQELTLHYLGICYR